MSRGPRHEASDDWRPTASFENLRRRAELLRRVRGFFAERGVLEVETPLLASATVTDLHLSSFQVGAPNGAALAHGPEISPAPLAGYLQTSPEFAMKRLVAAGSGPIYQICKAFRKDESGRFHNPEFTMLEWYRPGWDHHALLDEMDALLTEVLGTPSAAGTSAAGTSAAGTSAAGTSAAGTSAAGTSSAGTSSAERVTYGELFERHLGVDAHRDGAERLARAAREHGLDVDRSEQVDRDKWDRDTWLQLLLSHVIEPSLGRGRPTFVLDFPASQAALARIRPASGGAPPVAERFEVYVEGVELANGFHELADAAELRRRFEADLDERRARGLETVPIDERLLAALAAGFPDCAGVALGFDRLLLLVAGARHLDEVVAFPCGRA